NDHAVQPVDVGIEQLLAQIRRRIDEDARRCAVGDVAAFDQDRAPPTSVLRIGGIAPAPPLPHARHAARRAAAQYGDIETQGSAAMACTAGILANRRKALAAVISAISASLTPFICASTPAVCITKAGSFRLPRCGTGARNGASVSTSRRSSGTSAA